MDLSQTDPLESQASVELAKNPEFQPEKQPETPEIHIKQIGPEQYTVLPDSQEELDWKTIQKLLRKKEVGPLTILGVSEDTLDLQKIHTINWGSKPLVSLPTIDDIVAYSALSKQEQINAIPENLPICSIHKTEQGKMEFKINSQDINQIEVPESQDFLDFKTIKDTAAEIIENPSQLIEQFPVDTVNSEFPSYILNRLIMIFGENGEGDRVETRWLEEFVSKISFEKAYQIKDEIYYLFSVNIDKMTKREEVYLKIINYLILKKIGFKNTNLAFKTSTGTLVEFDSQAFRGTIDMNTISKPVISAYLFAQKAEKNQVFTSLSGDVIETDKDSDAVFVSLSSEEYERKDFTTETILERYFFYLPEGKKTEEELIDNLSEPLKSVVKGIRGIYGDEAIITVYHPNFTPRMYHTQGLLTIANILRATGRKIGDHIPSLNTEGDKYMTTPFLNIPPKRVLDGVLEEISGIDSDDLKEEGWEKRMTLKLIHGCLDEFNHDSVRFISMIFPSAEVKDNGHPSNPIPSNNEPVAMGMSFEKWFTESDLASIFNKVKDILESTHESIHDKVILDLKAFLIKRFIRGIDGMQVRRKKEHDEDGMSLEDLIASHKQIRKVIIQMLFYLLKVDIEPNLISEDHFNFFKNKYSKKGDPRGVYDMIFRRLMVNSFNHFYRALKRYKEFALLNRELFSHLINSQKKNLLSSIFNHEGIQWFVQRYIPQRQMEIMKENGIIKDDTVIPFKLTSMDHRYKERTLNSLKLIVDKLGWEFVQKYFLFRLKNNNKRYEEVGLYIREGEEKGLYIAINNQNNKEILFITEDNNVLSFDDLKEGKINIVNFSTNLFFLICGIGGMLHIGSERKNRRYVLDYMSKSGMFSEQDLETMHILSQGLRSDDFVPPPKKGEVEYGYPVCAQQGFAVSELAALPHDLREYIINTVREAPHKNLPNPNVKPPNLAETFLRGLESIASSTDKQN